MYRFDYFTKGASVSAIDKMIAEWEQHGTPPEVRLAEALRKLELAYDDRLRLQWRVHCQRRSNRETWEIVEMRRKWLGSDAARRQYANLLKRYQNLLAVSRTPERPA